MSHKVEELSQGKSNHKHGLLREVVGQPRRRRKCHLSTFRYLLQGVVLVAKNKKEVSRGCPWLDS